MYGMLQTAFRVFHESSIIFEWHKKFKESRESVRYDERCGRSKEVNTPELIGQRVRLRVRFTMLRFKGSSGRDSIGRVQHFSNRVSDNAPVHNFKLFTEYLTKVGIKTVLHRPYRPDLAPCDFWLFPKLRGFRYKTIEEIKEAVTKVIDMLTQEDFQKLLERYNKCHATEGEYFVGNRVSCVYDK